MFSTARAHRGAISPLREGAGGQPWLIQIAMRERRVWNERLQREALTEISRWSKTAGIGSETGRTPNGVPEPTETMPSTFLSLHYHIIFSTKARQPFIRAQWRASLHEYVGGTVRGLLAVPEAVGGVEDHIHLLVGLKATHRLADFLRELKKASSVWAAEHRDRLFAWQEGYAAFTVSPTNREAVRGYIAGQEAHHRKQTFEEELVHLLAKAGVSYDPRFLV